MHAKRWLLAALCGALAAGAALAGPLGPPCGVATLDSYVSLDSTGCSIGPLNFRDFEFWMVSSSSGYAPLSPAAITVTPGLGPQGPTLGFTSSGFAVNTGQWVNYVLMYNIDPPPVIIRGFEEEMETDTPQYPGYVQIITDLCVGGYYDTTVFPPVPVFCSLTPTLTLIHNNFDQIVTSASTSWAPVSSLGVWHSITLNAGQGGSADFRSLENEGQMTPEPAGWLLAGCGLLLLPLLRRRRAA